MPPLLRLLLTQPGLLTEHAHAYGELVATEMAAVSIAGKRQALWCASLLCCTIVAAVLAGVALMLWALLPGGRLQNDWVLIAVPLVPAGVALGCHYLLRAKAHAPAFEQLRQQIAADVQLWKELGRP